MRVWLRSEQQILERHESVVDMDTCSVFLLRAVDGLRRYVKGELQQGGHRGFRRRSTREDCEKQPGYFQTSNLKFCGRSAQQLLNSAASKRTPGTRDCPAVQCRGVLDIKRKRSKFVQHSCVLGSVTASGKRLSTTDLHSVSCCPGKASCGTTALCVRLMAAPDPHEVLGISKASGRQDVKRAFRNLAMQFHPDK